ncbi:MAG: TIGR02594 family protein [Xanthobacteraceae bacterium]
MITLRLGASGEHVKRLQWLLRGALVPPVKVSVDGDFGQRTEEAVKRFQGQHSLTPDGVVGPQTWTALGQKLATANPKEQPKPEPKKLGQGKTWMEIAEAELGVSENALPGQQTARILEFHQATSLKATTDETPWCSSFVNWVMKQAGYQGTNNALAKSWIDWGTPLSTPSFGAVAVIKKKNASADAATGSSTGFHVAFYVSSTSSSIRLLGGNQGDMVKYSNFMLSGYEVKAYRVPK